MATFIAFLKAIPGMIAVVKWCMDAWDAHQDNMTEKEYQEARAKRIALRDRFNQLDQQIEDALLPAERLRLIHERRKIFGDIVAARYE